jgi:hypothetical protein
MSELDYSITPTAGVAVATATVRLTAADVAALVQAGNPPVEFGGEVTATLGSVPTTIALPTNVIPVVDGLRVSVQFKTQPVVADNVALAQAWITKITSAVTTALIARRTQATAITGSLAGINTI